MCILIKISIMIKGGLKHKIWKTAEETGDLIGNESESQNVDHIIIEK